MDDGLHTSIGIPKWFLWFVGSGLGGLLMLGMAGIPWAAGVYSDLSSIKTQMLYQGQEFSRRIERNENRLDQHDSWMRDIEREQNRRRASP